LSTPHELSHQPFLVIVLNMENNPFKRIILLKIMCRFCGVKVDPYHLH